MDKTLIYQHNNFITTSAVSPQKDYIIFEVYKDNDFHLLFQSLVSDEKPLSIFASKDTIYDIGFINSGEMMIYSCGDIQYFMDMKTHEVLESESLHEYEVSHIATAIDTDRFVMSGEYCQIWDSKNKIPIWQLEGYRAVKEETVYKQNILIFEKNGWTIDFINDSYTHKPAIADISNDGKQIAVSGFNQPFVNIIDIDTGELLQQLGPAPLQTTICKFSPNYRFLAVVGIHPQCTFIWNLKKGERHIQNVFDLESYVKPTTAKQHIIKYCEKYFKPNIKLKGLWRDVEQKYGLTLTKTNFYNTIHKLERIGVFKTEESGREKIIKTYNLWD